MLGYLEGKLLSKDEDQGQCVLLTGGGTGYSVTVTKPFCLSLEETQATSLWIETVVREDSFTLYGFPSENEKRLFRLLLQVSGLGPKSALSLIGELGAEQVAQAILAKDTDALTSAPGVGKKTGQRIVLDLGTKIKKLAWIEKLEAQSSRVSPPPSKENQIKDDLMSALANLGYPTQSIRLAVDRLALDERPFEENLRLALKDLSKVQMKEGNA